MRWLRRHFGVYGWVNCLSAISGDFTVVRLDLDWALTTGGGVGRFVWLTVGLLGLNLSVSYWPAGKGV